MLKRLAILALIGFGSVSLAACDSAEERAEKHYQSGMKLLEKGDVDRALVEFRNVFKLNEAHHDARLAYARVERERGNLKQAYAQYLHLAERNPKDLEANRNLAELALANGGFEDARRYAAAAGESDPNDPMVQAVLLTLRYRDSLAAKNELDRKTVVKEAEALVGAHPDLLFARQILIDDLMRDQKYSAALTQIDAALELDPKSRDLNAMRISVLAQLQDRTAIEEQLKRMVELFPEDAAIEAALVRWYLSEDKIDEAEAYLRGRIDPTSEDQEPRLTLVRFLAEQRGADAAKAELERIIATDGVPRKATFRTLRAGLMYEGGQRAEAIAEMQSILETIEDGEEKNKVKVGLAQMLQADGNIVGARALIEEVLAADAEQVTALRLKANWLIDDDNTGDAIATLRTALARDPRDPATLSLLARAYEREGNSQLMGENLAAAVEASNRAPDETLRYASFLMKTGKQRSAEDVVIDALRINPSNVDLLGALGRVHVAMQDWARANQDVAALRSLESDAATTIANELQAAIYSGQDRGDDLVSFLEGLSKDSGSSLGAGAAVIRAQIARGEIDAAVARAQELLAQNPNDPSVRFLWASVLTSVGRDSEAEPILRALVTESPQAEGVWMALLKLTLNRGDQEAGRAIIAEARNALPDSPNLKWALAGMLERSGDIDGAIALYEEMYAANSDAVVVANNLASLIATYHNDPEGLERAYVIAKRLRDLPVPEFQDTYGWIAFRRGDVPDALAHLEPAAAGLPGNADVQYHLGKVYVAMDRNADALAKFRAAHDLIDPALPPAYMPDLEAEILRLSSGTVDQGTTKSGN